MLLPLFASTLLLPEEDPPDTLFAVLGGASVSPWPAETWDICSAEPFPRESRRRAVQSDGTKGPARAREIDFREERAWRFTVEGLEIELWRLGTIWSRTAEGTLPLTLPERLSGETGEGDILVVFESPDLVRSYIDAGSGSFEVVLREWRG